MFDFFKRKPKRDPNARDHVVVAKTPRESYDKGLTLARGFRPGMWVMKKVDHETGGRAGILIGMNSEGIAQVMLVLEDGTNFMSVATDYRNLRQAYIREIPRARITISEDALRASGYVEGA